MSKELIDELVKVTTELNELQRQIVPLYNRQQIILVKLKKEWNKH